MNCWGFFAYMKAQKDESNQLKQDEYLNLFDNMFNSESKIKEESDGGLSESDDSSNETLQDAAMTVQPDELEIEATRSRAITLSDLCIEPEIGKNIDKYKLQETFFLSLTILLRLLVYSLKTCFMFLMKF